MTRIVVSKETMTLVNVFTVDPAKQQKLIDLLEKATVEVMQHLPGFVSANLHKSEDGKSVINYAQWASVASFEAMKRNPSAQIHMQEAMALATKVEPHICEVVAVHATSEGQM